MKKIITLCILALVTIPAFTATSNEINTQYVGLNTPIITGPTNGKMGVTYEYKITFTDPQGDDVYYEIFWGDCAVIYHAGPYKSGEETKFSHAWCELCTGPGNFTIRVQASDDNNQVSNWGILDITMSSGNDGTSHNSFLLRFFEKIIERFPILEKLLDL